MRRVIVESPYGGDSPEIIERNLRYLRACLRDCLTRGEAPFASHGLYTQPGVLLDHIQSERDLGILAGFEWRMAAELTVVYEDLGVTPGMSQGIRHSRELVVQVEHRTLGPNWDIISGDLATSRWGHR